MPLEMLLKMPVHIFSEGQFQDLDDALTLRLSNVSAQLTIKCKNYLTIEPYLDWMTRLVEALKETNRTFRLRRFGIRKLDGFMSMDMEELESWLKTDHFYTADTSALPTYNSKFEENYLMTYEGITADLSCARLFRVGTSEGQKAYQALVDIQGGVSSISLPSLLQASAIELRNIGMALNDMLFFSFSNYITQVYIDSRKK